MGKAYSKAAKLRAKRKAMPELAATPRPKKRGHARMAEIKADPEAQRTVMKARARQTGGKVADMNRPIMSTPSGQVIAYLAGPDSANDLWETFCAFEASHARFMQLVIGLSPHAKTAKIEMMPETFEVRADDTPDDRTEDERIASAKSSWSDWLGRACEIGAGHEAALISAIYGWGELMRDQRPTPRGVSFVSAVMALRDTAT